MLFGGKKLPELARGLARGLRLFKDELKGVKTDIEEVGKDVKDIGKAREIWLRGSGGVSIAPRITIPTITCLRY